MDRETFKTQLAELFPGEKLKLIWHKTDNAAMISIERELTRLEIGHLFSLGLNKIKPCIAGNGVSYKLDLDKASLNAIYKPQII